MDSKQTNSFKNKYDKSPSKIITSFLVGFLKFFLEKIKMFKIKKIYFTIKYFLKYYYLFLQ